MPYGKDGTFYKNVNEQIRADQAWLQRDRQNKLLEEQNKLLKKQNELKQSNNTTKNEDFTSADAANLILDRFYTESNGKMSKEEALKLLDIKSSLILHLSCLLAFGWMLYIGLLDFLFGILSFIPIFPFFSFEVNEWEDARYGRPILIIWIIYTVYLIIKYNTLHKKVLKNSKKKK